MAKMPCEDNSTRYFNGNGSQFYIICVADSSGLDRTYTVFGEVFRGMGKMGSLAVLLLTERARSEGARSTRALEDQPGYP